MANHNDLDALDYSLDHVLCAVFPNGTPQVEHKMTFLDVTQGVEQEEGAPVTRYDYGDVKTEDYIVPSDFLERRTSGNPAKKFHDCRPWQPPPSDPIDAFAIAALLLTRSGAYHHVQTCDSTAGTSRENARRVLGVTDAQREEAIAQAVLWRQTMNITPSMDAKNLVLRAHLQPPPKVVEAWNVILAAAGAGRTGRNGLQRWQKKTAKIFEPLDGDAEAPSWWRAALTILMISDEAAKGVGFDWSLDAEFSLPQEQAKDEVMVREMLFRRFMAIPLERQFAERKSRREDDRVQTLSYANPDIICIMPKSRTPSLGCTMRSMSHHLSALPPRGIARAAWLALPQVQNEYSNDNPMRQVRSGEKQAGNGGDRTHGNALNLLLVPYPYTVSTHDFRPMHQYQMGKQLLGRFAAGPHEEAVSGEIAGFLKFVNDLLDKAENDLGEIHGVIFPELALSLRMYELLVDIFSRERKSMELVVAGLSNGFIKANKREDRKISGNFSAMCVFGRLHGSAPNAPLGYLSRIREKHHRWMLTEEQIATYSLGAALDPRYRWSEDLTILSRKLTVAALRRRLTVTTLICEDLARVDPAQEVVRAIGPNLIIALLMDGPQLPTRWPSRYASVLTEDPGSSVLTFTSLGLIERTNAAKYHPASQCIGLWRDETGVKEIKLPDSADAVVLTLTTHLTEEFTLDGRSDECVAEAVHLGGIIPIKSSIERPKWVR